jgi:anti-sigma B factor antagonist
MGLDGILATFERRELGPDRALVVTGELDLATAPRLRQQLAMLIEEAHSPALVDLSGVSFVDAAGLSPFLAARRSVEPTDVELVLLNPSAPVRRLLEITETSELFELRDAGSEVCGA